MSFKEIKRKNSLLFIQMFGILGVFFFSFYTFENGFMLKAKASWIITQVSILNQKPGNIHLNIFSLICHPVKISGLDLWCWKSFSILLHGP